MKAHLVPCFSRCAILLRFVVVTFSAQKFFIQYRSDVIMVKLLVLFGRRFSQLRQVVNLSTVLKNVSMNGLLKNKDWFVSKIMIKKILIPIKLKIQLKDDRKGDLQLNVLKVVLSKSKTKNLKTNVANVGYLGIMLQLVINSHSQ